eukprot:13780613-Ditylum_brightwellii.AAC.1
MMMRLSSDDDDDDTVKPNGISFATVIGSYLKIIGMNGNGGVEAVRRTENMLKLMEETLLLSTDGAGDTTAIDEHKISNDDNTALIGYNAALNVIAKSGLQDAGRKTQDLLQKMMMDFKMEPDVISYTSVVEAWAKQ